MLSRGQETGEGTSTQPVTHQPVAAGCLGGVTVLCVAEDVDYAEHALLPYLQEAGSSVDLRSIVGPLPFELNLHRYQVIIFAIASADTYYWTVCANARSGCALPIMLFLYGAARKCVLRGLESGADTYVLAPCDPRELMARLCALVRRQPRVS